MGFGKNWYLSISALFTFSNNNFSWEKKKRIIEHAFETASHFIYVNLSDLGIKKNQGVAIFITLLLKKDSVKPATHDR